MNTLAIDDEAAIRAARATSNRAIETHDIDGIASVWMPDLLVLSSTSAQLVGLDANRRYYLAQFARRPDTRWVRTPTSVAVMTAWDVAFEDGHWSGRWSEPDGPIALEGRYAAQWIRTQDGWRLQGELYVPTSCIGGALCDRPPRGAHAPR